jgi:Zn-dependent peptidase ImmA (M78 family)
MKKKVTPFTLPIPGFGQRPLTGEDFERACRREGITVERRPIKTKRGKVFGYYDRDGKTIGIDSRLKGAQKLLTEFHELAHHFLHRGQYDGLKRVLGEGRSPYQDWKEVEADAAALYAVAPAFELSIMLELMSPKIVRMKWGGGKKGGGE